MTGSRAASEEPPSPGFGEAMSPDALGPKIGARSHAPDAEREAAAKARAYHDASRRALDFDAKREGLARLTEEFYTARLGIRADSGLRELIRDLADPDTVLIEVAHDGQLPHLGIVRLVLKGHDVARSDAHAATLYLIGSHYSAAMRPANLRFGVPLNGESPDDVKHPPRIPIGKAHARTPFQWLPPPTQAALDQLQDRVSDFIANNLSHERKSGVHVARDAKERITGRLDAICDLLRRAARDVDNLGDWLIRVQHDLFVRMLGPEADRIVFLPMGLLNGLVMEELSDIARRPEVVTEMKELVSTDQLAHGEAVYQLTPEDSALWIHCPACFRRTRFALTVEGSQRFTCPTCGDVRTLEAEEAWRWSMPDIVAYEVSLIRIGIGGWMVGSRAPYHPVIERTYARLYGRDMPPKFFLPSVPVFRGIGDPPAGYGRTRLLRALLELEPSTLAVALRGSWGEDPRVESEFLSPPRIPHDLAAP